MQIKSQTSRSESYTWPADTMDVPGLNTWVAALQETATRWATVLRHGPVIDPDVPERVTLFVDKDSGGVPHLKMEVQWKTRYD